MNSTRLVRKDELLVVRGSKAAGLTARGRVMKSPIDQIAGFKHPNQFLDLRLEHISGPLKGVQIQFIVVQARKAKIRNVCLCDAYDYPHNPNQGKCNVEQS